MTIDENATEFDGRPVVDFDPEKGIQDVSGTVYRLRIDYDAAEAFESKVKKAAKGQQDKPGFFGRLFGAQEVKPQEPVQEDAGFDSAFQKLFFEFASDPAAKDVTALVVGDWGQTGSGNNSAPVVEELVKAKDKLPSLRSLFIGDMIAEESEISWITQSDLSPLWAAYPDLETMRIRGGNELSLGVMNLPALKALIIETGGLPGKVLREVLASRLPRLEHLELWLGDSGYGWDGTVDDLRPLFAGKQFPALKYLGLRNSEIADDLALALAGAPVLGMIETLDLSLGTLSDKGAAALIDSPAVKKLKKLDIHHHFLSDDMMAKITALPCEVDAGEQEEDDSDGDEFYRFVAVSE